jgi:hypothetical protein
MFTENNTNYSEIQTNLRSKIQTNLRSEIHYNSNNYGNKFISDFINEKIFINFLLIFALIYLFVIFKIITQDSMYPSFKLLLLLGCLTFMLIMICLLITF